MPKSQHFHINPHATRTQTHAPLTFVHPISLNCSFCNTSRASATPLPKKGKAPTISSKTRPRVIVQNYICNRLSASTDAHRVYVDVRIFATYFVGGCCRRFVKVLMSVISALFITRSASPPCEHAVSTQMRMHLCMAVRARAYSWCVCVHTQFSAIDDMYINIYITFCLAATPRTSSLSPLFTSNDPRKSNVYK